MKKKHQKDGPRRWINDQGCKSTGSSGNGHNSPVHPKVNILTETLTEKTQKNYEIRNCINFLLLFNIKKHSLRTLHVASKFTQVMKELNQQKEQTQSTKRI